MALITKTFNQFVQDQAAAIQSRASAIIDFTTGSVIRAFVEANAAIGMWLQGMVLYVLTLTRLSTSQGSDVDSWVNDWGIARLAATLSNGVVTFSRFTAQSDAVIPVGAQVQTADGSQQFQVVIDAGNASYSLALNGYLLPAGVLSVTVPVQSMTGSTGGNVAANTVTTMLTNIVGVDTVTNPAPFAGGSNAETDDQLRQRFVAFIASLSKATVPAIKYAVNSLQLGLKCTIMENVAADGTAVPGLLTITVDDGTGYPAQSLLDTASDAIANVRAAGITWAVVAPIVQQVNISVVFTSAAGYSHDSVIALVSAAITNYVNNLDVGDGIPFFRLSQIIYDASPGVVSISTLLLNGSVSDIDGNPRVALLLYNLTVS